MLGLQRPLGKPVKPRRARRGAVATRRVALPATASGSYRLLACVAVRRPAARRAKVRCAAAKRRLRITRPVGGGPAGRWPAGRTPESYSRSTPNPCFGGTASCNESFTGASRPAWEAAVELGLNPSDASGAPASFRLQLEGRLTSPGPCTGIRGHRLRREHLLVLRRRLQAGVGLESWSFIGSSTYQATFVVDGTVYPAAAEVQVERSGIALKTPGTSP